MIIGIVGKARSGKDTFAEFLKECFEKRHNRNFEEMAFAGVLKDMCTSQFDLSWDQLYGGLKEEPDERYKKPPEPTRPFCGGLGKSELPDYRWTPREIMQELGAFYRKIDYNYWVRALDKNLKELDLKDVIITDVRHVNESEYVKNNNGILIKIKRKKLQEIHGMNHESETALDDVPDDYFHIEINNAGTLEDLYDVAEDASDAIIIMENMIKKGETNG